MAKFFRIGANIVYILGTTMVLGLVALCLFGPNEAVNPEAMLPTTWREVGFMWLAAGAVPMVLSCMAVYKFNDIKRTANKTRNFVLIFLPGFLCSGCFLFAMGFLAAMLFRIEWIRQGLLLLHFAVGVATVLGGPIVLTVFNSINLARKKPMAEQLFDTLTMVLGAGGVVCLYLLNGYAAADYDVQLVYSSGAPPLHTFIANWHMPTVLVFGAVAIAGLLLLSFLKQKMPPLAAAACLSAVYLGCFLSLIMIFQLAPNRFLPTIGETKYSIFYFLLFPINYLLCAIRLVRSVIRMETGRIRAEGQPPQNAFLRWCYGVLARVSGWFLLPFALLLPLLLVLIVILVLFGQQPDAIIKAFTETSDWTFSQKVSPPSVQVPAHYLCTVALQGDEKLVRPTRLGLRCGEKIVVNRQLCVANAFEEYLQEKTPRLHRAIRRFYDRHGYPLSKHITTPKRANVTYLMMKPLEWAFVVFLYLFDARPENRIALQYTGGRFAAWREAA